MLERGSEVAEGMSRVELFEKIRRDHEFDGLSTHALARRYEVHRRTVRQALGSAVPAARKRPQGRPAPALGWWREWIDQILIADQTAPRRQRHTAKRIADRLAEEHGVVVAGSTMRDHVRKRRRELGLAAEAFCEQVHDPGVTAEVDWGEATVSLAGVEMVLGLFLMRSCFSGACFVMAFETQCQQAFFEGHVHALDWFSGVFTTIRYDNLAAAAKKTLKGRNRVENERFTVLGSHSSTNRGSPWWAFRGLTRRAASKTRLGGSGEITSCRSRRSPIWRSSTTACWRAASGTWTARSPVGLRRSALGFPKRSRCSGRCRPARLRRGSRARTASTRSR